MWLSQFPLTFHQTASFHCIAYDYSHGDKVFVIICERFHGRISLNSVILLLVNFMSGFRSELMYISLIVSIMSNLTHLHSFQLPVLLQ